MERTSGASAGAHGRAREQAGGAGSAEATVEREVTGAVAAPFPGADLAWATACSALDGARMMLELQRAMFDAGWDVMRRHQDAAFDAGWDVMRRQQEAILEAWRQGLRGWTPEEEWRRLSTGQAEGPLAFARLGFEAMDRLMRSLRAANDAVLEASQAAMPQAPAPHAEAPSPAAEARRRTATR
ncbi:hypothetical protein GCM10010964_25200 [Caldovatus sediminis]|uniref:Phasin domain-containing protein n=1 Tax=Caldovatus sediminis TaxID=2041189 RepID=A0A8J2ZBY7_9PROT|nr:hypothetical protein [Caldovatus sediminis]GGG36277.1 hypothetical protein GCM10010964_25200 [Caldovatus sediminis]